MIRYYRPAPAQCQVAPWRPAGLGSPSQLGTAGAGALIGAIIQGAVTLTMATIQIVMAERSEAAAGRRFRREQAALQEARAEEFARMQDENRRLQGDLALINEDIGIFPTGDMLAGLPSYAPYAIAGIAALGLIVLLKRRKKS